MPKADRTTARLLVIGGALLALVAASPAAGHPRAPGPKGALTRTLPERTRGTSVAVGPNGVAWFGVSTSERSPELARIKAGKLGIQGLTKRSQYVSTVSLQFDREGNLWFGRDEEGGSGENVAGGAAIARRAADGTVTETRLAAGSEVDSLAIGAEGDVWFTSGEYEGVPGIGRLTPAGAMTLFPLAAGNAPSSIVSGPDGAFWFTEPHAGIIGRITTGGEVTLFALGAGVEPRQIATGSEGALWFSENGVPGPGRTTSDRIGRITMAGEVTQFPIRFGGGTEAIAADPRGPIWFGTEGGEIASISPTGAIGRHACAGSCGGPVVSIALTPGDALWFAGAPRACLLCGGGADLIAESEGTIVGRVPAGALSPPAGTTG